MKKFMATLILFTLTLGLFGCGSSKAQAKVIEIELTQEEYAFGVDKNNTDLQKKVDEYIDKIMKDGTFNSICNNYFGDGEPQLVESAKLDSNKKQLVVATNAAFEPFEYTVGDKYAGIDMEIAKGLASYLGLELVISNMDFDAVCLSVSQGKADIAMAGLTVKEDRKAYVTFSKSYYNAAQKLVVLSSNTEFDNCKTAADVEAILKAKTKDTKAGVQNGTTGQLYCEGDAEWEFDGFAFTTVGYKNGSLAISDLVNGNLELVIIDSAPAACISKAINDLQ